MNKQHNVYQTSIVVLLILYISPVMSDSNWRQGPAQTDVYGARTQQPSCCYSQNSRRQEANTGSIWRANRSGFGSSGFSQRSDDRPAQPSPLPRDAAQANPWSTSASSAFADRSQRYAGQWPSGAYYQPTNYQPGYYQPGYYQPEYNNYPSAVALGADGSDTGLMLPPVYGYGPWNDPYLGVLGYPGLGYPGYGLTPFVSPLWLGGGYGPGYAPGIW